MKREQVFVRAKNADGKWGNSDVLDLTEESFLVFILERMVNCGMIVDMKDECVEGEYLELTTNKLSE